MSRKPRCRGGVSLIFSGQAGGQETGANRRSAAPAKQVQETLAQKGRWVMASDGSRLRQVSQHIRRIKAAAYPVIEEQSDDPNGGYRVVERPWQALPEGSKLAILREAVDWSGISNGDLATILLSEIDFARITGAERKGITDMMAARGGGMPERGEDRGIER